MRFIIQISLSILKVNTIIIPIAVIFEIRIHCQNPKCVNSPVIYCILRKYVSINNISCHCHLQCHNRNGKGLKLPLVFFFHTIRWKYNKPGHWLWTRRIKYALWILTVENYPSRYPCCILQRRVVHSATTFFDIITTLTLWIIDSIDIMYTYFYYHFVKCVFYSTNSWLCHRPQR